METSVQKNLKINYLIMVNRINPIVPTRIICFLKTSKEILLTVLKYNLILI